MKFNPYFLMILLSVLFQALSVVCGKKAALGMEGFSLASFATSVWYIASLGFLGLQAVVWQLALKKYPLSFAYLFNSLVYILILFFSYLFFHEPVTVANIIGALIISGGIFILAGEKEHD